MACIHNKVKLCSTSDHYPVYATIQEDEEQGRCLQKKKKGWAGWKTHYEEARIFFQRIVVDQKVSARDINNHPSTLHLQQTMILMRDNLAQDPSVAPRTTIHPHTCLTERRRTRRPGDDSKKYRRSGKEGRPHHKYLTDHQKK